MGRRLLVVEDLFLLLKGLGKLDVPKGTEVWSADALHQP